MKYDPIPAPQAEVLRDSSAAFRKEYRNWFISNIENRIRVLNNTLKTSDFPIKIDLAACRVGHFAADNAEAD
ncbi:hypothetical protein, partial [Komagataeibacter nataicola]|uniref:hypothetical protein n=1 Tax=Komagataeibacter nataicola TaxID=265960 RepID=UPI002231E845